MSTLEQVVKQVHQQWRRHEPIMLAGTMLQVANFLHLCATVEYPTWTAEENKEMRDEHSN